MGVMEMSHRGKEFISIYEQAEADLRELLAVPANFKILFMQGGGLAENAIVPLEPVALRASAHWRSRLRGHRQLERKVCQKKRASTAAPTVAATGKADRLHTPFPPAASWQLQPREPAMCTSAATKPSTAWSSTACPT